MISCGLAGENVNLIRVVQIKHKFVTLIVIDLIKSADGIFLFFQNQKANKWTVRKIVLITA